MGSNFRSSNRLLWIFFAAVIGFQLYHLYGLHVSKDLPLWDESAYIGWGDEFLQDGLVGSITNAPAYHLLYAGVIRIAGLIPSFFVVQYLLKLVLTALVLLVGYQYSKSTGFTLLLGVLFAYSTFHVGAEVLVYYGAMVPYFAAILTASRAPVLSLGLSFLAGLGRLEYMAVPLLHGAYLILTRGWRRVTWPRGYPQWSITVAAVVVWSFNLFALTRITVWQFHNRLWFAWSQNYAFFRYLTGRDASSNPWLDHQFIAERDFPGAHSLAEAIAVNPSAFWEHTWFNVRELPEYLGAFIIPHHHPGIWQYAPWLILAAVGSAGVIALITRRMARADLWSAAKERTEDLVLAIGGAVAAAPGLIVSSKTNYIMSLLPLAILVVAQLHRVGLRLQKYGRWSEPLLIGIAAIFAIHSLARPVAYTTEAQRGPVYRDVMTMRQVLEPYHGLKILGVSTASFVNYLGRANGHQFIEPLAISPINPQAEDLSLDALVGRHDPDVLLINSHWKSSRSYETALAGFSFENWDAHPLVDGTLYLRKGLKPVIHYGPEWYDEETLGADSWRWSPGDATVSLVNGRGTRDVRLLGELRTLTECEVEVAWDDRVVWSRILAADSFERMEFVLPSVPPGATELVFRTRCAPTRIAGDTRALSICLQNLRVEDVRPID